MRVCLDVQAAIAQRAGVGRYTLLLAQHLATVAGTDGLTLLYFDFKGAGALADLPKALHRRIAWCPGRVAQWAWKTLRWPPVECFAGRMDVFHGPNFILPPVRRARTVVTIHDVSFLRHPEFTEERNLRYLTARIHDTAARADAVITDSRFSAGEIVALLGVPPERVHPIHLGIGDAFRPAPTQDVEQMRARLGLRRPYLLSVGTLEPRKNIPFLVEVFEQMQKADLDLVIAGGLGWKYDAILARIQKSPRRSAIRLLHYVEDRQLPALYTGAECLLHTSIYEGFGFPPLEAMACGTPVISSTGGSLPEVLGDAAVLLAEPDAAQWAARTLSLLNDPQGSARLALAGRQQAARYSWPDTARKTWDVYREVCS